MLHDAARKAQPHQGMGQEGQHPHRAQVVRRRLRGEPGQAPGGGFRQGNAGGIVDAQVPSGELGRDPRRQSPVRGDEGRGPAGFREGLAQRDGHRKRLFPLVRRLHDGKAL